ncbi:unnamed protein product, partial [Amoebophrya sp. A25]|eukprot:GSA25T00003392001.1
MPSSPAASRGRGIGGKADPLLLSTSGADTSKAGDSTSSGANKVNPHLDGGVAVEAVEAELEDVVIAATGDSSTTSVKRVPRTSTINIKASFL